MALIRQSLVLSKLTLLSLRQRPGTSLVTLLSMAIVSGVLIATLSVTAGLNREFRAGVEPEMAIVLPADRLFESSSGIARNKIGIILDAPGIARDVDGKLLGDGELSFYNQPVRRVASGASLKIRGMNAKGLAIRSHIRMVSGRMFESGRRELIIGTGAEHGFGLKVGDTVSMRSGTWPIVGAFEAEGVTGDELCGDADTMATLEHQSGFGSVHVRLTDPAKFDQVKRWLTTNPALHVSALTQLDYYGRLAASQSEYFTAMAYFSGVIMSLGALFGSVNILYGIVGARTREMAILRGIGYEAVPVASSVVFESLLLAFAGSLAGASVAWLLFNGHEIMKGEVIFRCFVSPELVVFGVGWASVLALVGSVFPAMRAARLEVIAALRIV